MKRDSGGGWPQSLAEEAIDRLKFSACVPKDLALEHLQARFPDTPIRYWKDNAGRELDFVLAASRDEVDAVECKWNPSAFDSKALRVFRSRYPNGRNYLVTPSADPPYTKALEGMDVLVCTPSAMGARGASGSTA